MLIAGGPTPGRLLGQITSSIRFGVAVGIGFLVAVVVGVVGLVVALFGGVVVNQAWQINRECRGESALCREVAVERSVRPKRATTPPQAYCAQVFGDAPGLVAECLRQEGWEPEPEPERFRRPERRPNRAPFYGRVEGRRLSEIQ